MINKCGVYCKECYAFEKECPGCKEVEGTPFWTEHIGGGPCPIHICCEENQTENCGKCSEIPCKTWYDLKDPSSTHEQHLESIKSRIDALKGDK